MQEWLLSRPLTTYWVREMKPPEVRGVTEQLDLAFAKLLPLGRQLASPFKLLLALTLLPVICAHCGAVEYSPTLAPSDLK